MSRKKLRKSWLALFVVMICIAVTLAGLSYYNRLRFSPRRDAKTYSSSELYSSVADSKYIKTSALTSERYYSNEIIVYVKSHLAQVIDQVDHLYNCKIVGRNVYDQSFLVRFPDGQNYAQLTKRMNRITDVPYVRQTSLNYALDIDSESLSSSHKKASDWNIKAIKARAAQPYASLMKNVKVGILDTGFDETSADLSGRLHVIGHHHKAYANHGSHIAGIIGGKGHRVTGVAPRVELYGIAQDVHTSIYAIMTNLHILDLKGCRIMQISIGSDELNFAASQSDTNAKNALRRMGRLLGYSISRFAYPALLICGSGNGNGYQYVQSEKAFYGYKKLVYRHHNWGIIDDSGTFRMYNEKIYGPKLSGDCDAYWNLFNYIDDSDMPSKIIVAGSSSQHHGKYDQSSFSVSGTRVNVLAPGRNIYSVKPRSKSGYGCLSGTAQAAAHVSGLAAVLLSLKSDLSIDDLDMLIKQSADIKTDDQPMIDVKTAIKELLKHHPIDASIHGRVTDDHHKPLKNASVTARVNGKKINSVKTDDQGSYTIKGAVGTTDLSVRSPLYETAHKKLTITHSHQKAADIQLEKSAWKSAYLSFIKKHKGSDYALWQVNDDDIPELMIFSKKHNYLVSYVNGRMIDADMGAKLNSLNYRRKGNLVFASYTKKKTLYECYWRIGKTRIETVHVGSQKGDVYIWDGTVTDAKKYAKLSEKMANRLDATDHRQYHRRAIQKKIRNY